MKQKIRGLIILFAILLPINHVLADGEQIIEYKLEIFLNDSSVIEVIYPGPWIYPNLDSIQIGANFDFTNYYLDTITTYLRIYPLKSSIKDKLGWIPYAVIKDETIKICTKDIKKAVIKDYKLSGFYCNYLIDNLNKKEILRLSTEDPIGIYIYKGCFENDLQWVYIMSYNIEKSEKELLRLIDEECCVDFKGIKGYQRRENGFNKIQETFRKQNVLMFRICIGN